MDDTARYPNKGGVQIIWNQIIANFTSQQQAAVITSGLSQVLSMTQDNYESILLIDGRVGDLESYFDGDTANKATKLATARTLWGRSFDGTANVTGDLENVGDIIPSGDKTKDIGSESHQFSYVYANRFLTSSGTGMRYCATTGRHGWYNSYTTDSAARLMELNTNGDLAVKRHLSTGGNVEASWGVAANGIASMEVNTFEGLGYKRGFQYSTASLESSMTVSGGDDPTYDYWTNTTETTCVIQVNSTSAAESSYGVLRYVMIYNNKSTALTIYFFDQLGNGCIGPADSVSIPAYGYVEFRFIQPTASSKCFIDWTGTLKQIDTM